MNDRLDQTRAFKSNIFNITLNCVERVNDVAVCICDC